MFDEIKYCRKCGTKKSQNLKYCLQCGEKYESYKLDKKNSERKVNILYGIPKEAISGILVGKEYEKNKEALKEIRELFPDAYICNLEGLIILD